MASNDVEVLDPAVPVEKDKENKSGYELDRRHFFTALGVAGVAAAGAALLSSESSDAQQPTPNGFAQVDVLNLMLNVKYLKATLYSYLTTGADLPPSSFVTLGTGGVFNAPKQMTFSGTNAQQITDVFNEMYYDELNQLIALRGILGTAAAARQTVNLLATGPVTPGTASGNTPVTVTYTQGQAIALARMLEDLSTSAFATATIYLTGQNLQYAAQALASDGLHAGAVRLIAIQTGVQYQGTQFASVATSNTSQSAVTFSGSITSGKNIIYAFLGTNAPSVGNVIVGNGIPPLGGAVITALTNTPSVTVTAITTKTSPILTLVSDTSALLPGQPITGTNVPGGSYITAVGSNTITINANASGSTTKGPTGFVTNTSPIITAVSDFTGLIAGQPISGNGIDPSAIILPVSPSLPSGGLDPVGLTITMSKNATATSLFTFTGILTKGDPKIASVSSASGIILGQNIFSATGIPANTTILSATSNSVTMSVPATASTDLTKNAPTTFTGIVTNSSTAITLVSSVTGLAVGQLVAGPGVGIGAAITAISAATSTVTVSVKATATSSVAPSGNITLGSNILTGITSVTGVIVGQPLSGTGIPSGATVASPIGTNTLTFTGKAATLTNVGVPITITSPETLFGGGQQITSNTTETVTSPTTQTYTIGQSVVTIAGNANQTGVNTYNIVVADAQDVQPGDPGVAATSASGPSTVAGTSPAMYQGFFNTAGAATSSANTPPGFAFARTFQQVLAVLYGYNATNSVISTQNFQGGFYPNGVSGPINSTI